MTHLSKQQIFVNKYFELRKDFTRHNINKNPMHLHLDQEDSLIVMYDDPFRLPNFGSLKIEEIKTLTENKLGLLITYYRDATKLV